MTNRVTPTWQLLSMATGGKPEAYLKRRRDDGATFQAIADDMARDFSITVSREWVRLRLEVTGTEVAS